MSYGDPNWQSWVLPEEEGIKQIKAAYVSLHDYQKRPPQNHIQLYSYDAGINAFDIANVNYPLSVHIYLH